MPMKNDFCNGAGENSGSNRKTMSCLPGFRFVFFVFFFATMSISSDFFRTGTGGHVNGFAPLSKREADSSKTATAGFFCSQRAQRRCQSHENGRQRGLLFKKILKQTVIGIFACLPFLLRLCIFFHSVKIPDTNSGQPFFPLYSLPKK